MTEENKTDTNVILIGEKEISRYMQAINIQLQKVDEVIIKKRGKFTSKAISLADICQRNGKKIANIKIGSDPFKTQEGKDIFVSTIEILIQK